MPVFDIIISIPLLWAAYKGFKKGLIIELASLIALAFGVYGAIGFSGFTGNVLKNNLGINSEYNQLTAFAITFIVIVVAVFFLAKLLENVVKMAALHWANKLSGSLFSILKYALILSAMMYLINSFDKKNIIFNTKLQQSSLLYKPLQKLAPMLFPSLKNLVNENPVNNLINEIKQGTEKLPIH
ncbi:MAG: CvpA family protein [Bacteroidia bacterium]|nr:CvpA family protein [Bacteroidia bacterium]